MNSVGICLKTSWQAIEAIMGCMQAGMQVCILNVNWPAISVDGALHRLGIENVLTTRTDLRARSLGISTFRIDRIQQYQVRNLDINATTILHTSGSSIEPKAVLHSVQSHIFSANSVITNLNLGDTDRWLLSLPIWHVSGMSIVFRCLIAGSEIIVLPPEASLFESLSKYRITHVSMVSTQLMQVMNQACPASLRAVILGGGPTPAHVVERAINNGWPIQTTYGMTETSSMVTLSDKNFSISSSGYALQGYDVKIATDREILVRSPAVCSGYLYEGKLQSVVDEDGWFHTGDLGQLNGAGELYVQGRKDNMFISGGENISPEEIEHILGRFSKVKEVIVVPVPDAKYGQRPVAFIRGLSEFGGLREFLEDHLPKYQIPICYTWPDRIPSISFKRNRKSFSKLAIQLQENSSL
ncbi:MAG: o-succinylbenzoate--CoA ligase [Bacteroidetes bacterium]|nr:o-succinylbenzoate--CoA ligase [Bacteroidota bacterium]MCY4204138.1 o-succinylbenzoate--CoA ligase [Bacteroidota bacterium]